MIQILHHHGQLEAEYTARMYDGPVHIFRPVKPFEGLLRDSNYWGSLSYLSQVVCCEYLHMSQALQVTRCPGNHITMMRSANTGHLAKSFAALMRDPDSPPEERIVGEVLCAAECQTSTRV